MLKKKMLFITLMFCVQIAFAQSEKYEKMNKIMSTIIAQRDSANRACIGKPYPEFNLVTLNNDTISDRQLLGKVTFINFWFTTCGPCVAEFNQLNLLYDKYKDNPDFQFISITLDPHEQAMLTVKEKYIPYWVCSASREECGRLNMDNGFPTNIIVDKSGKIVFLKTGGSLEEPQIKESLIDPAEKIIDSLLQ